MSDLRKKYTDIKNNEHKVEHFISPDSDNNKEQIIEELSLIMTRLTRKKQGKRISA